MNIIDFNQFPEGTVADDGTYLYAKRHGCVYCTRKHPYTYTWSRLSCFDDVLTLAEDISKENQKKVDVFYSDKYKEPGE